MPNELRIFLSSTKEDFEQARKDIIKFLGVLRSDLIAMEVFGSDESKPVDYCLKQVRKCNIFIGIYAERYGFVDTSIGKSITELEYIEARKMLEAGKLKALLIYVIDSKAQWPLNLIDRDAQKIAKLSEFKQKLISSHMVSFFFKSDDLPFLILRDVIHKIGVGSERLFRIREHKSIIQRTNLDRPIGMEYYGEDFANLFFGRSKELDVLEEQILKYKMNLLIGASGVGKTSLLHAGLIIRMKETGWQTALVRPLSEPVKNLKRFLWDYLLSGDLPSEFDLSAVFKAISTAYSESQLIIIIDQFEDILSLRNQSHIEEITTSLLNLYKTSDENIKILICYRGDVEPQIGSIWQRISGAPQGLPRTYLGPLERSSAEEVLTATIQALKIKVKEERDKYSFINNIISDLETESFLAGYSGIYPPFLQIIIAHIFEKKEEKGIYYTSNYFNAGQAKRIIAHYLIGQLKYLGNKINSGKSVLIALVSSYGTKTQRTLWEISIDSLLSHSEVSDILNHLIDLRLVRSVDGTFEIAHDFLAKIITSELVSAEEREAKKFKELLASRTAAYETTKANLTSSEHLYIYRYRNKILLTDDEFKLLLRSYLSGNGPISYWAKRYSKIKLKNLTDQLLSERNRELQDAAFRFLIKLGYKLPLSLLAEAFSDYKEQHELSVYINKFATAGDIDLLLRLVRKKPEEVVRSSQASLTRLIKINDEKFLKDIAESRSNNISLCFEKIALNLSRHLSIEKIREGLASRIPWRKLLSIYALSTKGDVDDLEELLNLLKSKLNKKFRTAIIKTAVRLAIKIGEHELVNDFIKNKNSFFVEKTLEAIDQKSSFITIGYLMSYYNTHPSLVSEAIYRISTPDDVPELKNILSEISLEPSSRAIVYALCKNSDNREFSFLFNLFLSYDQKIHFWNPFSVVDIISDLAKRKDLALLKKVIETEEFWQYFHWSERPESPIPAKDYENIYFIKRLAGRAFGKIAKRKEFDIIFKMLYHEYWIIRNAALLSIKKYGNEFDIEPLLNLAFDNIDKSDGLIEALCIIDDNMNKFD